MAPGRTRTTWAKGQGGKPKGAKDKLPRGLKASVRKVYEDLSAEDPLMLPSAIRRGLQSRKPKEAYPYVRLCAELAGELKQVIQIEDVPPFEVIDDGPDDYAADN